MKAIEAPIFFPSDVTEDFRKYGKAHFSHTALARGYVRVGNTHIVSYSGKYGIGFVIHHATLRCPDNTSCGNRYHVVTYYLFKKK